MQLKLKKKLKKKQQKEAAKANKKAPVRRKGKRKAEVGSCGQNKKKRLNDENTLSDMCCVCLGRYADDAGTDREWIQCKCSRWLHEDCVDFQDSSPNGSLCPLC